MHQKSHCRPITERDISHHPTRRDVTVANCYTFLPWSRSTTIVPIRPFESKVNKVLKHQSFELYCKVVGIDVLFKQSFDPQRTHLAKIFSLRLKFAVCPTATRGEKAVSFFAKYNLCQNEISRQPSVASSNSVPM